MGLAAATTFVAFAAPLLVTRLHARLQQQPQQSQPLVADGPIVPAASLASSYTTSSTVAPGTRIGTIAIPALHLTAPIIEGVSDADLKRGVGHVPGSAQSGGLGNVVLAAHRDTLFRPLRAVEKGMQVEVSGAAGTYRYQVESTRIVAPNQLEVMDIAEQPEVTLITCYPFNFIGSAPMRFVVKARLLSALPDASSSGITSAND